MNNSQSILDRDDIVTILQGQMVRSRFGIKSLSLFGSVARNDATQESDLDFIVNFDGMITFDRYMDLKIFLEDLFGKKIDLAIEDTLKPQIRQKILEDAITSGRLPPTMSRSLNFYLEDIIEAIRKIYSYTNSLAFEEFCVDERTIDAVIRNLIVIGEAVKNIPEDARNTEPGIEWRKIAGLRDFAAHAYFNVSNQIVWDVVQTKLLPLNEAVTRILNES